MKPNMKWIGDVFDSGLYYACSENYWRPIFYEHQSPHEIVRYYEPILDWYECGVPEGSLGLVTDVVAVKSEFMGWNDRGEEVWTQY